jgi:hypothetical protein
MADQTIRLEAIGVMQTWRLQAEAQIQQFHQRLDTLLTQRQGRMLDLEGMNPAVSDDFERFYSALDGMRDDRVEYQEANVLAMLDRRMEDMQHAQQQAPHRQQGMGL